MRSNIEGHYYVFWWSSNEDPNMVQPAECDSYKEAVDCASEYRRKGYESSILSPETGDFVSDRIRRKIAGLTVIIWWTGKVEVWRGEPLKSEYIGAFVLKKRAISQR